jgi:hydroxymethylpyrimidine pyrophosphatase-like HAD family hydrolase
MRWPPTRQRGFAGEDAMAMTMEPAEYLDRLARFVASSRFRDAGAVITDLDGTAVLEEAGRVLLSPSVSTGLELVHAAGREVMINTLRFPLSVIRVIGEEWRRASGSDMVVVTLKGSLVGRITSSEPGALAFEEIAAFPLTQQEVSEVMRGVRGLVAQGADDILVFFYPRDWRLGELIWTPDPARVEAVRRKYLSASEVFTGPPDALEVRLAQQEQCMVFLLIDAPGDRLMAYQHTQRTQFITHAGVDKRHGAQALAGALGISLEDSIGSGDAEPDTFLDAVGLAVIVGNQDLAFKGLRDTLRLPNAPAFGDLLIALARGIAA